MKLTSRLVDGTGDLAEAFAIRVEVFCDEQGYRIDQELDELDRKPDTWHLILYLSGKPAATGRLYPKGEGVMGLGVWPCARCTADADSAPGWWRS